MKQLYKISPVVVALFLYATICQAQVTLNADGPGNTYELINSVLAPGYNAVEAPDVAHPGFGRHIAELFDAGLNKNVFEFYSHLATDDDPSTTATDRQRVEIKTYDQSPANLLGVNGETVTYKWRFKIAAGFQPSDNFTHLHQIKAVGGDDADPIFTLTARKGFSGGPNKMQLMYTESSVASSVLMQQVDLSLFENTWVEATEKIDYSTTATGRYSLVIRKVSDNSLIMSFAKIGLITLRPDNTFARPKWGIYRSILTPGDLRDEAVRFADFSIAEGATSFTQSYYWIGGVGGVGITGFNLSDGTKWNTIQNGTGVLRSDVSATPQLDDVLIMDGANIGGNVPTTGLVTVNVTGNTFGQFILQNNASVLMKRSGGTTGTLVIAGDATNTPDFVINNGCTLTINNDITDGSIVINLPNPASGLVSGTVVMVGTGQHRITSQTANGLVFASGASFTAGGLPTTNVYAFGSSTQGVQNGVQFMAGSNLIVTGNRSPFGGTSTFQSCSMMPGSNTYFRLTNVAATGSWTNLKTFGNVFIQNNTTITSDGPLYKVDSLTIDAGSAFVTHSSGNTPILGNLVVNGTYTTAAGSNVLVLGGSQPQTVSGSGAMSVINLVVANYSDVTMARSIAVSGSTNIYGKINFGTGIQITGAGSFSTKANTTAVVFTGNTIAGSYQITNVTAPTGITGLLATGAGLDANTNVVGFSATNTTINISKPAISSTTGTTFTFTSDSATLITANSNGLDTLTGSIVQTGNKSFATGTNIIINAATAKPFAISSGNNTNMQIGNLTLNAAATTNYNVRVRGTVTLNSGKLSIRPLDTLRIVSGNDIAGAPFNASKYIVSGRAANDLGILRMDNFSTAKTFPIGTAANYLPVTLTPTAPMSYAVSVFEGATVDGTPAAALVSAPVKDESVDAVWTINRTSGSGDCAMELNWVAGLEGATFSALSNANMGISRYNGAIYEASMGSGNNAANNATASFGNFSPFIVTKNATVVPVNFKSIMATIQQNGTVVKWNVANELATEIYIVERSNDGRTFVAIGSVVTNNSNSYTFTDVSILVDNISYYRIKIVSTSGNVKYSSIVFVRHGNGNDVVVYPNPVNDVLSMAGLKGNTTIKIINAGGQIILQQNTTASSMSIDAVGFYPGIYTIQIVSNGIRLSSQTFIKQ